MSKMIPDCPQAEYPIRERAYTPAQQRALDQVAENRRAALRAIDVRFETLKKFPGDEVRAMCAVLVDADLTPGTHLNRDQLYAVEQAVGIIETRAKRSETPEDPQAGLKDWDHANVLRGIIEANHAEDTSK